MKLILIIVGTLLLSPVLLFGSIVMGLVTGNQLKGPEQNPY